MSTTFVWTEHTMDVTRVGTTLTKTSETDAPWGQAYSTEGARSGGLSISFTPGQTDKAVLVGFEANPTGTLLGLRAQAINHAWYADHLGNLQIYELGTYYPGFGTYTTATTLALTYDGAAIYFYKNGVLVRTTAAVATFYFAAMIFHLGGVAANVEYGHPAVEVTVPDTSNVYANPLLWVEWDPGAGDLQTAAEITLPDPQGYYGGLKRARLLEVSPIRRALSGPNGDYETGRFDVTLADTDRAIRGLLATAPTSYWRRREVWLRLIDDADRRQMRVPRLLAFGTVDGAPEFRGLTVMLRLVDVVGSQKWAETTTGN